MTPIICQLTVQAAFPQQSRFLLKAYLEKRTGMAEFLNSDGLR
jgi:hypothetical protein